MAKKLSAPIMKLGDTLPLPNHLKLQPFFGKDRSRGENDALLQNNR